MWKKCSSLGCWRLNLSFSLCFSCNLDLDQNSTQPSGHQLSVSPGIDLPRSSSVRSSLGCLSAKFASSRPKLEHGDLCWVCHDLVWLELTPLTHTHFFFPFSSCFHLEESFSSSQRSYSHLKSYFAQWLLNSFPILFIILIDTERLKE